MLDEQERIRDQSPRAVLPLAVAGVPEVLTDNLAIVSDATPMWHAVRVMHDAWLGLDAGWSWIVFGGLALLSAVLAKRFFRWE
jgi:hypothetical protein